MANVDASLMSRTSVVSGRQGEVGAAGTLRTVRRKDAEEKGKEAAAKAGVGGGAGAAAQTGTGWLLRFCWANLIPSFGLTLIYINLHAFLRFVLPEAFCKFGDEWRPKVAAANSAKNIGGTMFGMVEIMGLILIDALVFVIILTALTFLFTVAEVYVNWYKYIGTVLWVALKGLADLLGVDTETTIPIGS